MQGHADEQVHVGEGSREHVHGQTRAGKNPRREEEQANAGEQGGKYEVDAPRRRCGVALFASGAGDEQGRGHEGKQAEEGLARRNGRSARSGIENACAVQESSAVGIIDLARVVA